MADLEEFLEAIELTTDFPESAERAVAFAELAETEAMHGLPNDTIHAEEAVRIGRTVRLDAGPWAGALRTRGGVGGSRGVSMASAPLASLAEAERSVQLATACGDTATATDAAIVRFNALHALGRWADAAEVTRAAYFDAVAAGAGSWAYFLAGMAAARVDRPRPLGRVPGTAAVRVGRTIRRDPWSSCQAGCEQAEREVRDGPKKHDSTSIGRWS